MISGMYMGELVRLALVKFTQMGLLFGGRGSDLLFQRGSFYTKYVSEIESDKPGDFTSCMDVLEELGKRIFQYFFNWPSLTWDSTSPYWIWKFETACDSKDRLSSTIEK